MLSSPSVRTCVLNGTHHCADRYIFDNISTPLAFLARVLLLHHFVMTSHGDNKSQITPLEQSQLRALNGQLLWLGMQCLPLLLAPSRLIGQKPQATVGTTYGVNKLAREATAQARTPLKIHAHHSPVVVTHTDAGWTTRPDGTSQGGQLVFIANSKLLQGRESNIPGIRVD